MKEKDIITSENNNLFTGIIHQLERGVEIDDRPFVKQLAQFIVDIAS